MDYAAVTQHKNEHMFMCISDGLLSLFTSLNNNLNFYIIFSELYLVSLYVGVYCSFDSFAVLNEECDIV